MPGLPHSTPVPSYCPPARRETTRAERLIGGTKPQGVMSTGSLQLILETGQIPFRRPVILGTELVAFSAILSCRLAGIRPVAMIEPNSHVNRALADGPVSSHAGHSVDDQHKCFQR